MYVSFGTTCVGERGVLIMGVCSRVVMYGQNPSSCGRQLLSSNNSAPRCSPCFLVPSWWRGGDRCRRRRRLRRHCRLVVVVFLLFLLLASADTASSHQSAWCAGGNCYCRAGAAFGSKRLVGSKCQLHSDCGGIDPSRIRCHTDTPRTCQFMAIGSTDWADIGEQPDSFTGSMPCAQTSYCQVKPHT